MRNVNVIGVGMTKFTTPKALIPYNQFGLEAARDALKDADIDYKEVQQAYVGYVYGDSCAGEKVMYDLGTTGIPVFNVNNNCSTGSNALFLARQAVAAGVVECAMAVGFEQMTPGALGGVFNDRPNPMENFFVRLSEYQEMSATAPPAAQLFGSAGIQHQKLYGTKPETFAKISVKARKHAEHNERAVFRNLLTLEEVMESPHQFGPLTRYQCCPPTCGGGAAIVCSDDFAKKHNISKPIYIAGQAMTSDFNSTFEEENAMKIVGYDMTAAAVKQVYETAGLGPDDVDVVELHDCFTANELITYEGLGLTPEGTAEKFIEDGDNTYGGKVVTNPSGGLLSKGHPLGATGLAQCAELVWQLRGTAGVRQVEGAQVGLQHNIGLGGAAVVTMYRKS
ncbi:MAG: lipid-transfer protein [Deltaproteobacteria bacterium]|jgi:sterol carrier protein 2|nr:lipid-transfer protein [Deltaproteobacteria bacterium]MBT4637769.1 lipid-transfer protein [Deltaproteobacteria bacterium]MBT6498376.1 lipid-transfer protein [Deltaproteobacteria bacterium]MBT7151469.1 lipid-transfer protein [Deltaproteobacteria bacterium]MBT7716322.1 lipid-transfer protein [Deltaproteobacteria bacterium]